MLDVNFVLFDIVGIVNFEEVYGFNDFVFVFGVKKLVNGGGGFVKNIDKFECFVVVFFGESEFFDSF